MSKFSKKAFFGAIFCIQTERMEEQGPGYRQVYLGKGGGEHSAGVHLPGAKIGKRGFSRHRRRSEKFLSYFLEIVWKFVNKHAIRSYFLGDVVRYISKISKPNFWEKNTSTNGQEF